MSAFFRRRVEATIEHLITVLNEMDGDTDLEPETIEDEDDREFDPAEGGIADELALRAILAEYAKRQRRRAR